MREPDEHLGLLASGGSMRRALEGRQVWAGNTVTPFIEYLLRKSAFPLASKSWPNSLLLNWQWFVLLLRSLLNYKKMIIAGLPDNLADLSGVH